MDTSATNVQVIGLPSGVSATYSSSCSNLNTGDTCSIQLEGSGSASPGTYSISIVADNVNPVPLSLVVEWPSLSTTTTTIANPSADWPIALTNTSNVLVHLGSFSLSGESPGGWSISTSTSPTPSITACGALSANLLAPGQTYIFNVLPPDNVAGDSATINIAGTELPTTYQTGTLIPLPTLSVVAPTSDDPIILSDGYSQNITINNTDSYIAVPNLTYALDNPSFATDGTNRFTVTNNCSGTLNPSSTCTMNMAFSTSTANIAGNSTTLRVSANGIEQSPAIDLAVSGLIFSSSHATDQYAAYDKLLITNGTTPNETVELQSLNLTGTDVDDSGFPSNAGGTDPDTGTLCTASLTLNPGDQCHLWLHASATAPTASANNFNLAITYALNGVTQAVKNLTGTNRTVVYAGGMSSSHPFILQWDGSNWTDIGGTLINAFTYALVADPNGNLYAGGQFTTINGGTSVNYIAEWDGTTWLPLGNITSPGLNGYVNSLAYNNNKLYAGGGFTATAAGATLPYIAQWDGSNWSILTGAGAAISSFVYAISPYQTSSLFAGGAFNSGGFSRIAKWNLSSTWTNVANGVNSNVWSLAAIGADTAYVGGEFTLTISPAVSVSHIGLYQSGTCYSLAGGVTGGAAVYALQIDASNHLYAAGDFTGAGGAMGTNNIAKFTPSGSPGSGIWSALSIGLSRTAASSAAYSLAQDPSGDLYVGGTFDHAGMTAANNVAVWNGSAWSALGSGITGSPLQVRALAVGSVIDLAVGS